MSGFLLDTNIPSELIRTRPEPRLENWFYAQDEQALYLSVMSIGELRRGFVLLSAIKRRAALEQWFENDLVPRFRERILPVTYAIADRWGRLDGESQLRGAPLNTADGLIAATALEHALTLVTRNVKDFAGLGVTLFNPWDAV
ncbi:MAG TPA: type II toxin-antitoxin system VapC family toxin [Candidatus Binataceae bacterium]|nr:type II toxin-antitoxin system VapC family toxin [Candidatus Binataceae bacterium]